MTDWFRSWHGAPTDPKWLGIAKRAGVAPGIAVAVAWALMDRASQATDRGSIEGYDADGLACFFGCDAEQVDAIVLAMTDKGILSDGRFTAWEKRQPKREDNSTERVREHREREKQTTKRNVTQCNAPDTDTDTDNELRSLATPDEKSPSAKRGTRLSPDWRPSDEDIAYAVEKGVPPDKIATVSEEFLNFWTSRSGRDAVKLDWPAVWRNRVLQVCEQRGWAPAKPNGGGEPQTWVDYDEPAWMIADGQCRKTRGYALVPSGSKHGNGQGAFVPTAWLTQEAA